MSEVGRVSREIPDARVVPMAEWGKDHWSTLAYAEARCVDFDGELDKRRMRSNPRRHPQHIALHDIAMVSDPAKPYPYGSFLNNMRVEPEHDDWDCLRDLEVAGLLEDVGTGLFPKIVMTDEGRRLTAELRLHKSAGGHFASFVPPPP